VSHLAVARAGAIGLAIAAMSLTRVTLADQLPADSPTAATTTATTTSPPTETPLQVRPSKPLALETSDHGPGVAWKVLAVALIAAAGFFVWQRRSGRPGDKRDLTLQILRRTSVGVRSELVVVEVEGQRLLLGVTPHSIQSLLILPEESSAMEEELALGAELPPVPAAAAPRSNGPVGVGYGSTLARLESRLEHADVASARRGRPAPEDEAPVEQQARGLLALRARP
jgi:hypothetical protein